jgi:hypothetical protein
VVMVGSVEVVGSTVLTLSTLVVVEEAGVTVGLVASMWEVSGVRKTRG